MVKTKKSHAAHLLLSLLLLGSIAEAAGPIAIRGGTVLTVSGDPIEDGTVLIADGKIRAVGRNVVVPSDAQVINARDKFIMPGLIDAQSSLYIMEGQRRAGGGGAELDIIDALDPFAERTDEVLAQGITAVCVAPSGSGILAGQGAVLRLNGSKTPKGLVLKQGTILRGAIGKSSNGRTASLTRLEDYANLRETLIATQAYMQRKRQYEQDLAKYKKQQAEKKDGEKKDEKQDEIKRPPTPLPDPAYAVLERVLAKKMPLQIEAHRAGDIRNALDLAEEFGFRLVLEGCTEGYTMAEEIARAKVPVVVGPISTSFTDMPQLEYRNHSPSNAGILATAGIQTALGVAGRDGLSSKFLPLAAASAVAGGMDEDAALRAVTLTPAEIFGVADRIGSLDEGKDADIVILTAHPFETTSQIERVLIQGKTLYERKSKP